MGMQHRDAVETARNMLSDGKVPDAAAANVLVVQLMGVMLITTSIPREVRAAYSAAVKAQKLGHLPKKGHEPEAYFHINAKWDAMEARGRYVREMLESQLKALKSVTC